LRRTERREIWEEVVVRVEVELIREESVECWKDEDVMFRSKSYRREGRGRERRTIPSPLR